MSELKTNKISPAVGTDLTLGDSGDTINIPAGATIVNSGTATGFGSTNASDLTSGTLPDARFPATLPAISGANLTGIGGSMTPAFAAYHTATITLSAASATAITLGSEYFDTDSAYNVSDGRFTVPSGEGGKYWFSGQFRVKQGETNTRQVMSFTKNGALIGQEMETRKAASTGYLGMNHSVLVALAAGDYVQLMVYISGGGSQDTYDYSFYGFKLIE